MKKILIIFLCIMAFLPYSNAQENLDLITSWNKEIVSKQYTRKECLSLIKKTISKGKGYSITYLDSVKDKRGNTHIKYQQNYKEIAIEGAIFVLHEKSDEVYHISGKIGLVSTINVIPNINKETALSIAKQSMRSELFAWQSKDYEDAIKEIKQDDSATFFPEGELIFFSESFPSASDNFRLTYKFDLFSLKPYIEKIIYIDAQNGEIIKEISGIKLSDENGTVQTQYYGNRPIVCDYQDNIYSLKETARNIETNGFMSPINYDSYQNPNYPTGIPIVNISNNWTADPIANEVHWASEQWHDYFSNNFNWNGINNNNGKILNVVHFGNGMNNAFWNGAWMSYGDGNGSFNSWTSLDIVAHEISHGFIDHTAGFIYWGESGALSESFADIFATAIEHESLSNPNWLIGEDITINGNGIRSMNNPNTFNMPMTYEGNNWNFGNSDNGGVHTNSSVQNRWFYLLSQDIGIEDATTICFHSLRYYLTPYSQYYDARNASIQSAKDLFGNTSPIVQSVCNHWQTVGLNGACSIENVTVQYPNGGEILTIGNDYNITWTNTANFEKAKVEFSPNNGNSWIILASLTDNDGSMTWHVPNIETNEALIRVSNANNLAESDISNAIFSIEECEAIPDFIGNDYACIGTTITFNNTSQNATSYEWLLDGMTIGNNTNLTHIFNEVGNFNLELRADNNVCYNALSKTISIVEGSQNVANFQFISNGTSVTFNANSNDNNAIYNWSFGDENTGEGKNILHNYANDNLYQVCLEISNACGVVEQCQNLFLSNSNIAVDLCPNEWEHITTGLNDVQVLYETINYIWIGTYYGGLVRVSKADDSSTFFNVLNSGIPSNRISDIEQDAAGNLWLATEKGLVMFDGFSDWTVYDGSNSIIANYYIARTLDIDVNGNIWLGTANNGLYKFDGNSTWIHYDENDGLPDDHITAIDSDSEGNIWIGSWYGLSYFDVDSLSFTDVYDDTNSIMPHPGARNILVDSNDNIWIIAGGNNVTGIGKLIRINENGVWIEYGYAEGAKEQYYSISEDNDGLIWFSYRGPVNGIGSFDGISTWNFYNENEQLSPNVVAGIDGYQNVIKDQDGHLWIGTFNEGVFKWDNTGTWSIIDVSETKLTSVEVLTMFNDSQNKLWFGGANGYSTYDGNWLFNPLDEVSSTTVYFSKFFEQSNGDILGVTKNWIQTEAGIVGNLFKIYNTDSIVPIAHAGEFIGNGSAWARVEYMEEDGDGNIWLASNDSIYIYDGVEVSLPLTDFDYLAGGMYSDSDGNIWILGANGLVYKVSSGYIIETFDLSTYGFVFDNNNVCCEFYSNEFLEDNDGNIWIYSKDAENGFIKLDENNNLTHFDINSPSIPENSLRAFMQADDGLFWGVTESYLFSFDGVSDFSNIQFINNPNDKTFIEEDAAGKIWLLLSNGITSFLLNYDKLTEELLVSNITPASSVAGAPSFIEGEPKWMDTDNRGNIYIGTSERGVISSSSGIYKLNIALVPNFQTQKTCAKDTSHFINQSNTPLFNEWQINGITVSNEYDLHHYFESSGTYEITLIASAGLCNDVYTETVIIPAHADELDLPNSATICGTDSLFLDAERYTYESYEWKDADQTIISTEPIIGVLNTGEYYLSVLDSCGNIAIDTITVIFDEDCVWPGDTNKDFIVNNRDILYIGLAFDAAATARFNQDIDWYGHSALFWDATFENLTNYKHTDTDGDGIITTEDVTAIDENYKKEREEYISPHTLEYQNAPYSITPNLEAINPTNGEIELSVTLGNNDSFDIPFYGLAFSLLYETPAILESGSTPLNLDIQTLGTNTIFVQQQFPNSTEIGLSRTDHQNVSNNSGANINPLRGLLRFVYGTEDELPGGDSTLYMRVVPTRILMLNNTEDTIPVKGEPLELYLNENFSFSIQTTNANCNTLGTATAIMLDTTLTYDYLWSNGMVSSQITDLYPGYHSLTITSSNGTELTADSILIEGSTPLTSEITYENETLTVNTSGGDGNYNYSWNTGETTTALIEPQSGTYIVTITDSSGCFSLASYELIIISNENLNESAFQVFQNQPNPFNDETIISFILPQSSEVKFTIYNIYGQKIAEHSILFSSGNNSWEYRPENLFAGIYICEIEALGEKRSIKIIHQD